MAQTEIQWASHVWNPVTGCDRVSPGCAHCYALTFAGRLKAMGQEKYQRDGGRASGPGFGLTMHWDELDAPTRWRKPRRVFVNSMSDLFHEEVTSEFINAVWMAMYNAPSHDFLVLTKRPERLLDWTTRALNAKGWPADDQLWPPNVWLGTSIENRRFVHRADTLRQVKASVRFISAEPLLGPLLPPWADARGDRDQPRGLDLRGIDWLIVGGESGHGHRRIDEDWVRALQEESAAHGTAFFLKQWGGHTPKAGGRELDGRTWDELPAGSVGGGA